MARPGQDGGRGADPDREVALGAARLARLTDRMRTGAGWVGIALILAGLALINGSTPFPGPMTLLPVLGTTLLIAAAGAGPLGRLLSSGPAVRIGDWSYSIYLWHWPITIWLVPSRLHLGPLALNLVRLALTIAVAAVSFLRSWRM